MEIEEIICTLIAKLKADDMWFTTKQDPTFVEASDYYKLDEYGDLTDKSKEQVAKEIESYIGDGAVAIADALDLWINDAMAECRIAYTSSLVTIFKDKPVVDGIDAFVNPVPLAESKSIEESTEYKSKFDDLEDLIDIHIKTNDDKLKFYNHFNDEKLDSLDGDNELKYDDWKAELSTNNYDGAYEYLIDLDADLDVTMGKVDENIEVYDTLENILNYSIEAIGNVPDVLEYKGNTYKAYNVLMKNYQDNGRSKIKYINVEDDVNSPDDYFYVVVQLTKTETGFSGIEKVIDIDNYTQVDNNNGLFEQKEYSTLQQLETDELLLELEKNIATFDDLKVELEKLGYVVSKANYDRDTIAPRKYRLVKNNQDCDIDLRKTKDGKYTWKIDESKQLTESAIRRLNEENNKSANIISQMFQADDFDSDSNQGKIVMRTSELFNALSDKQYDVQVSFDNGESQSAILLGQQGGKVLITITNAEQPLRAFASGNFEITDDNIRTLADIQEQITAL